MQKSPYLGEHPAFRIDAHIAASAVFIRAGLQNLRREPEAGFARAGRADDAAIQIAGIGRIFGPCVDGELFRPGENDIVFKLGIDKGLDVLFRPP